MGNTVFEIKPHELDKIFEGLELGLVLSNDLRQCLLSVDSFSPLILCI